MPLDPDMFRNPPNIYRGQPFWSINDGLDESKCYSQMKEMLKAGFGGAFFHAREGLEAAFLGDEWFRCFSAALRAAEEVGGYLWIYDEDRWPSGFAGGYVPALSPRYRAKALYMIPGYTSFRGEEVLAVFRCILRDGAVERCERVEPGSGGGGYLYLTFVKFTATVGETWFSGFSYVDLLSGEAVKKFIEFAYEPYVKKFPEKLGKVVPGVFTDEPNFNASRRSFRWFAEPFQPPRGPQFPISALPWGDELPEMFKKLNGYDIVEKLPELFFNIGSYTKTRFDFWRTVTLMFLESFTKQIYEWCDKHGLRFTGHFLNEDSLLQMINVGAVMPHYEYMHIPGVDQLGYPKSFREVECCGNVLAVKQVASVANQLGKERVLSETYGCTGNYPTFADRKWIGDFLYALGVNLLNHHLIPYSMRGRRKKDYGLNIHPSQPWWKYNRIVEDYFARLSYVLSQGVRVVDVLVIHPITSAWSIYTPLNQSEVLELDKKFKELLWSLLDNHIDFELGDEIILEKHGRVKAGAIWVGRASYSAVIVPPSVNLTSSTVKLLREFVNSGGLLIAVKPLPTLVDGSPSAELSDLFSRALVLESPSRAEVSKLLQVLKRHLTPLGGEGDVLHHFRSLDDGVRVLFLANTSREKSHEVMVGVEGLYSVELWDPVTGEISEYSAWSSAGRTWFKAELPPIGSALFIFRPGEPRTAGGDLHMLVKEVKISGPWRVRRRFHNVLVLDYARIDRESGWSEPMPVWKIHREAVKRGLGASYALQFEFYSEVDFSGRKVYLVVEYPEQFDSIAVNGVQIDRSSYSATWIDENFKMYEASKYLRRGLNVVELRGRVTYETEIENAYILGDFGVKIDRGKPVIVEEAEYIEDVSDLTKSFYPFYVGEIELETEFTAEGGFRKAVLKVEKLNAAVAEVYVNDSPVGVLAFPPYGLDVSKYVKPGVNKLKIILVGTLRNALGPLHHREGDPWWTSRQAFEDENSWTDSYMLRPFGVGGVKLALYG